MVKEKEITKSLNEKATVSDVEAKEATKKTVARGNVTVCSGIAMGLKLPLKNKTIVLNAIPASHIVSAHKNGTFLPAGKFSTTIVSAEEWDEIVEKYGKCDFIVNGVVFAKERYEEAVEVAKEKSEGVVGFEQADPKKGRTRKKQED